MSIDREENKNWVLGRLTLGSQEEKIKSAKKTGKEEERKKIKRQGCSGSQVKNVFKGVRSDLC